MVSTTIRYGLAVIIFAHGIGHVVGFWGDSRFSWALTGVLGEGLTWALEVVWMLVSAALFLGAVMALLDIAVPHETWRTLVSVAALVSIGGIVLFWGTWPGGTMFFAFVFDLALLVVVVWYEWPTEKAIGF